MIPAAVIAGIEAFGSSWRTTTCRRSRPFPLAVRTNDELPTSKRDGRRIRIVAAATPIPSVIAGSRVDLTLSTGSAWKETYPWVGSHSSSTPRTMIRPIPITNVGIAIPTAAKPDSSPPRIRFGQIAPATDAGTAIRMPMIIDMNASRSVAP